ncbi:nucleotidyltransferase domain-containing protein [Clostridium paraputrificum]|uniref:nucleotidyltransferase domain-containing protein n=1 Tax=Clostridium TaxID=1485 RepID=UPI003D3496D8
MANRVIELQNAFKSIVNTLRKNKKVVAIFTFGSIISGDVWDESDIDLFVVYDNEFEEIRDVYSEVLGVPVHTKILNKKTFLELYENEGKRGFVRNLLSTSKLVYSLDEDIIEAYNKSRYSMDIHVERWNLVYLGKLLKDLGICKKYLQTGGVNTSYEVLIRTLDSFSKLYINLNGYAVTKDSLAMATNLNNDFNKVVEKLFSEKVNKEEIKAAIDYIDNFLELNLTRASKLVLDCLYEQGGFVSSYEVMNNSRFKEFNIRIEYILKELTKRDIILKDKRVFKDSTGSKILDENVYSAKIMNN